MANHFIREGASGSADGSDWTNAWTDLPASLTREDTYYIADGSYSSYTFDDAEDRTKVITIKKATASDHGTETGWDSAYGDGQAVLGSEWTFKEGYYTVDGNGSHTVPSDDTNDYGFKISHDSSTSTGGIIAFAIAEYSVSNIIVKYTHVYNTTNGTINNGTVGLRFYGSSASYIKVQNCFLQNCGKDGIQISGGSYLLFERNYIERYGKLDPGDPDYHGQTVQIFYGGDNIIFRYNYWEANEGQGLIQIAGISSQTLNVRFYGNVVFNKYGETTAANGGFNTSGGIIGNAWDYYAHDGVYVYNSTFVNIGGDYGGHAHFPMSVPSAGANEYGYNNLFYNCGGNTGASGWTAWDYHASGGCDDDYGGANEQTGIASTIFADYDGNDFTLASNTNAGKDVSAEGWWDDSVDSFWGQLDYEEDMYGNTRTTWSRGAFEYDDGGGDPEPGGEEPFAYDLVMILS